MKHQLSVGGPYQAAPKDPLAEPMGSRPDAAVLKDLEERHELFDSSQEGTVATRQWMGVRAPTDLLRKKWGGGAWTW